MLTGQPEDLLSRSTRAFLGTIGHDGPDLTPTAFWHDGEALWTIVAVRDVPAAAGSRTIDCAAYVPPMTVHEGGVVVHGRARVHSLDDPLGLALHAATISAAMTALAAHNAAALAGSVRDAALAPHRWWPRHRCVLRLVVEQRRAVDPPDIGAGVAPPLPTVVPPDVRRALGGKRRVVVATDDEVGLQVTPAVWSAGYALRTPPTYALPAGVRAAVTVDPGEPRRSGQPVGLVLHGRVGEDRRLEPERVVAWHGSHTVREAVSRPAPGGIALPD